MHLSSSRRDWVGSAWLGEGAYTGKAIRDRPRTPPGFREFRARGHDARRIAAVLVYPALLPVDFFPRAIHDLLMAIYTLLPAVHVFLVAVDLLLMVVDLALGRHRLLEVAVIEPEKDIEVAVFGTPRTVAILIAAFERTGPGVAVHDDVAVYPAPAAHGGNAGRRACGAVGACGATAGGRGCCGVPSKPDADRKTNGVSPP